MKFPKLCLPSKIYLVLSLFSIILALFLSIYNLTYCIIKLFFAILWTWILNLICKSGYTMVAWFILLLPIILFLGLVFFYTFVILYEDAKQQREAEKNK